jgi:acetoin:2,6-dichlorophenolindophenol oxidoreductase subunit alpha
MQGVSQLGGLADARSVPQPLDVTGFSASELQAFLECMLRIRLVEEEVARLSEAGAARAPCHLGIGQEAVAAGVAFALRATDRVFGGHRSHSQFVAMGGSLYGLLAEVLGKKDGVSHGRGGSMHLFGRDVGFHGSVPLVGATIPLAVGAGIAAAMDGGDAVGVAFFGDGATEEGVFHESLNLASTFKFPVLFVCENNLFSSHLHITQRQPSDRIARYGEAHCVASRTVDGNDVTEVARVTSGLLDNVRQGKGPALLEAVTFRHRGHVGPKADIDVGVQRSQSDVQAWMLKDPIARLARVLETRDVVSAQQLSAITDRIAAEIREASSRALAAPYPDASELLTAVYAGARP